MIITDSDAAGFRIRHFLENIAGEADIINVFIPDIYGKEHRKAQPSKEGKLGVEAMPTAALEEALRRSGAFEETDAPNPDPITYTDLYEAAAPSEGARFCGLPHCPSGFPALPC